MKKWIALLLSVALAWGTLPLALAEDVAIVVEEAEASVEEAGSRALFEEAAPEEALMLSGEAPEPADADSLGQSAAPLANASDDFEIDANGVLVKYNGPGGDVIIPDGVTSIGQFAFESCNSLTSVTIPGSVTSIGRRAFHVCRGLTSATLMEGLTSIGNGAFQSCSGLTRVDIPSSVTSIGEYAFELCKSLTSVTIPNGITRIAKGTFAECYSVTNLTIPNSVTSIGPDAFRSLRGVTSLTLPNSLTSIENSAFAYCRGLTSIVIPDSVTLIGYEAFSNCDSLTSITIPSSVTDIGWMAFSSCPNLTIYGEEGSKIQSYAQEWRIPFVVITIQPTPTPPPAIPTDPPTLASTSLTLGVGETFKLIASGSPVAASQCKFKSKDKAVAKVSSKGVVTGVTKGKSTTITVTPPGSSAINVKVKVKKAPTKVTLTPAAVELDVGRTTSLAVKLPSGSASAIQWKSSKKKVATVDAKGIVTAVGAGTAKITATTFNGKNDTCVVTVWKTPTKISLDKSKASIKISETYQLNAKFSKGTRAPVTWYSDDKNVALVDQNGLVTGVGTGKANIRAVTPNGMYAECKMTVKKNSGVKYRALLIGQSGFSDIGPNCANDVKYMKAMLKAAKGPTGSPYSIAVHYDVNKSKTLKYIKKVFADADDDDVSLFYISTHGDQTSSGKKAGRLSMRPSGTLLLSDLANALAAVPGKVIVLIDACGSGAAIYDPAVAQNGLAAWRDASASFDASVVSAFADADPGLWVDAQGNGVSEAEVFSNTGEFRMESKFCVLTASRYQELSWSATFDDVPLSYFAFSLTRGVGTSGPILADSDNNRVVTLDELFRHISRELDDEPVNLDDDPTTYYQHVQVYPKDSNYPLFRR